MCKKVYVIVPAYNADKYVDSCLKSILNQTYINFTVIVIDDASTDDTLNIINHYVKKDKRIVCIHSDINKGVASARNLGLDYVQKHNFDGFICFVDVDDFIHPAYLQVLVDKQKKSNADIVWCQPYNTEKRYPDITFGSLDIEDSKDGYYSGKELLLQEKYRIMYSMVWGKLFSSRLWNNVRFPEELRYYEDGATTFKAIYNANLVLMTDLKMYYYYYSPNSSTRSGSSVEKCECGIATAIEKIDFYKKHFEEELVSMAYVGYANTLLKNIRESNAIGNNEYMNKMKKTYKQVYLKAIKCNTIGIDQKSKFIVYRFFPSIQKYYIKIKLAIMNR